MFKSEIKKAEKCTVAPISGRYEAKIDLKVTLVSLLMISVIPFTRDQCKVLKSLSKSSQSTEQWV